MQKHWGFFNAETPISSRSFRKKDEDNVQRKGESAIARQQILWIKHIKESPLKEVQ